MRDRRRGGTAPAAPPDPEQLLATAPDVADNLRYLVSRWKVQQTDGVPRRLGLTATLRGEGVTYLSHALAAVLSHDLERSVCVVDLDWWSPTATAPTADLGGGLAGVLRGEASLDDALERRGTGRLWRLPAGSALEADRAVLAQSPSLEPLLEKLAGRFDHVLLDLPALRSTGAAVALAALAEECVLVVRHGVTTLDQVRDAVEQLQGVHVAGVILNKHRSHTPWFVLKRIAS